MRRTLALAVLATATLGGTAHAACYGLEAARVCYHTYSSNLPDVDPEGSSIHECVYTGSSCKPVDVPVPTVETHDGPLVSIECYVGSSGDNLCYTGPE